ncbi:MAG: hypothetical protein NTU57_02360 [Candidatus Aenigmarchaeota archaeon]|nr:hypothetical protein [Candidatus Aenigmarchaeota archaeon]
MKALKTFYRAVLPFDYSAFKPEELNEHMINVMAGDLHKNHGYDVSVKGNMMKITVPDGEDGISKMPGYMLEGLKKAGLCMEEVFVLDDLTKVELFGIEMRANRRGKTIFPIAMHEGGGVEIVLRDSPYKPAVSRKKAAQRNQR